MQPDPKTLGEDAPRYARNPLGIIALFIVFVYLFAALVAGPFGGHLSAEQKWLLIIYLVSFPVLVLAVFAWLVTRHHTKLYAPSDFRDDASFIGLLSADEQKRRLDDETARPNAAPTAESATVDASARLRGAHLLAEDLALRRLELELNRPIRRQAFLRLGRERVAFDGVNLENGRLTAIEVMLVTSPAATVASVRNVVDHARKAMDHLMRLGQITHFDLLIALVPDSSISEPDLQRVGDQTTSYAGELGVPVTVPMFRLADLERQFGVEGASQ